MIGRSATSDFWRARGRLQSIDVLRGLAALAVLLGHLKHHKPDPAIDLRFLLVFPLDFGYLGVPLFVVLSGFCIHLGVAKRMAKTGEVRADWVAFWKRRFYRLYPPYVAAIALGLACYYLSRPEVIPEYRTIASLPWDLATHLAMVANLFAEYWAGVGNFPLWTLCMEEQLYLLYAGYVLLRRRLPGPRVLLIALGVTLAWRLASPYWPDPIGRRPLLLGQWDKWALGYWFAWVLGAIAAESYAGAIALPPWCHGRRAFWAAAILGFLTNHRLVGRLTASHYLARQSWGPDVAHLLNALIPLSIPVCSLAFFLLVNRWVRAEVSGRFGGPITTRVAKVGLFSYSLYLIHIPVTTLAESALQLGDGPGALAFRYLVLAPATVTAAYLFFQLIESRFLVPPATRAAKPEISIGVPASP